MKKLLLITAVAALGFSNVNAQEVNFGAKAGLNFSSFSGDDTEELDGLTSFHIGGVAEISISDKFSVQPELLYSIQGASAEDSYSEFGYSGSSESTVKLSYLNIPIMAKYYIAEGFSVEAGPQIGLLLSAKEDYEYSETFEGETFSESGDEDVKDSYKGIDLGFNFGLGYKMDSGLNFSARYNLGLSNIYDGEGSDDYSINNNVLQVSVGFFF
ncbi:porin family protein [Winogradskyella wichelsiae]|uniref:porin family protein n=1 Tax=Winogradskyella wichelsiae TaxID=2697007 RepID=UPI0015C8A979|nr:porin family protein [Winogradskyella wichelsiae]